MPASGTPSASSAASGTDASRPALSRRNFVLGIANGGLLQFASSLTDPGTVLTVFVLDLMPGPYSVVWLGLLVSLIGAGWYWPPVFLVGRMSAMPRRRPFYRVTALCRVVASFALWAAVATIGGSNPLLLFIVMAALQMALTSAGGAGLIPFFSMVTDSIPATWRGRFFGARATLGGLLAFAGGLYVSRALQAEGPALWESYSRLFLLSAVFGSLSPLAWSLAWEPPHAVERHRLPLRLQLLRGPRRYRRDANFRRLIRVRMFHAFAMSLAFPFVTAFALETGLAGKAAAGAFLAAGVLGRTASNLLWSYISDRQGNRRLLLVGSALVCVLPLAVLLSPAVPVIALPLGGPEIPDLRLGFLLLLFVLIGAAGTAVDIGQTNYLLEAAPAARRAVYLGFYHAVLLPASFAPLVGALIIGAGGAYATGFALAAALGVAGIVNVLRMEEVRGAAP